MSRLARALSLKYGDVADCNLSASTITRWRHATLPQPNQSEIDIALAEFDLVEAKTVKRAALSSLLKDKIALGWVYNTKTYQCHDFHATNMDRFMNAYNYFWATVPTWATATAYSIGDIRREVRVFYRCAEAHTSGTFATDLAAGKWVIWYFHPKKGGDGKWRDLANAMNALTTEQVKTMCEGALNYNMSCQAQTVVHKDAINALGTVTLVNAYDMTTGWPANS